jgi:predicted  nucleic acid-binding Zn-ribbon protein
VKAVAPKEKAAAPAEKAVAPAEKADRVRGLEKENEILKEKLDTLEKQLQEANGLLFIVLFRFLF